MNKFNFQFDVTSFNKILPFYILIDKNLNIKSFGESLLNFIPNGTEVNFFNFFSVKKPQLSDHKTIDLYSLLSQNILIGSVFDNSFWLKGKVELHQDCFLFIGAPYHSEAIETSKLDDLNNKLDYKDSLIDSLFESLPVGVLLEDENGNVHFVNKKFCSMFALEEEPKDFIGLNSDDFWNKLKDFFVNNENFKHRIDEILYNQKEVSNEELELNDGSYYERSFVPIKSKNRGNLWLFNDITLNKRCEASVNIEREKYRSIIENMNIGLIEVDNDDVILLANQSISEMSGYTMDFLIGKKASELFLDKDNQQILNEIKSKRKLGLSGSYEISIINKSGELKKWFVSGAPSYNINGEIVGSIGLNFDITQTKDLENQREELLKKLENQNQQLTEYAQVVSHDLKSPLRSIHSLITFIKEDNDREFNDKTAKYFVLIQEKVEKMDHLIQGILTYSKIDSQEGFKEEIDLNDLLNYIMEVIFIPSHIKVSIKQKLPIIKGDRFRIQQLFQNILSNAINYNDKPDGVVEVSYREEHDQYVFSIYDNGMGIPLENQKRIFQMFQSFNTDNRSTGVGLSIVRKIVENLNEKIWFESEEDVATTFYFTIQK